jgi:hypothetical protein
MDIKDDIREIKTCFGGTDGARLRTGERLCDELSQKLDEECVCSPISDRSVEIEECILVPISMFLYCPRCGKPIKETK